MEKPSWRRGLCDRIFTGHLRYRKVKAARTDHTCLHEGDHCSIAHWELYCYTCIIVAPATMSLEPPLMLIREVAVFEDHCRSLGNNDFAKSAVRQSMQCICLSLEKICITTTFKPANETDSRIIRMRMASRASLDTSRRQACRDLWQAEKLYSDLQTVIRALATSMKQLHTNNAQHWILRDTMQKIQILDSHHSDSVAEVPNTAVSV